MKNNIKHGILMILLIIGLILAAIVSLCVGQYKITASDVISIVLSNILPLEGDWTDTMYRVVMYSRFPRIVAAIAVGGALSLAGAAYQGVFRNPLVSPDLLGVSNGACVGAAISIIMGLGYVGNVLLAFIGGLLAVAITVLFPSLLNKKSTIALVLSGVIVLATPSGRKPTPQSPSQPSGCETRESFQSTMLRKPTFPSSQGKSLKPPSGWQQTESCLLWMSR